MDDHVLECLHSTPGNREFYSRCVCGWRSNWQMHRYAAERALTSHAQQSCAYLAEGFCAASVDGYCIGGRANGICHG